MPSSILNTLHGHGRGRKSNQSSNDSSSASANSSFTNHLSSIKSNNNRSSSESRNGRNGGSPAPPAKRDPGLRLSFRIESPPLIMYGLPTDSTGALLSGVLDLTAFATGESSSPSVTLAEAEMAVVQEIKYIVSGAVASQLPAKVKIEELATWNVLTHPHTFDRGATFGYPFSHLLPGALPPTCRSKLFDVRYYLRASARDSVTGQTVVHTHDLTIGRSYIPSDKTSVRIFPPTDLTLSMILPNAVFPQSTIRAEMRLEGLIGDPDPGLAGKTRRWQVKRINWRMDETTKVIPPAPADDPEAKVEPIEDKQTVGYGQRKSGWKSDYQTQKGITEFVSPNFCPGALERVCKDVSDPVSGIYVSHILVVEALIAEEILNNAQAKQGMLTGSARILRMQFNLHVADRPGLGISWDDEVPPSYADVPLSPPSYGNGAVGNLPSFEEVSNMVFSPALSPAISSAPSPTLRHVDGSIKGPESNIVLSRLSATRPSLSRGSTSHYLRPSKTTSTANQPSGLAPSQSMPAQGTRAANAGSSSAFKSPRSSMENEL